MIKIINLKLKNHNDFQILFENKNYAIVFKPPEIPTAPLIQNEAGTLLAKFLQNCPDAKKVQGIKKQIEHGLIHRLDTPTSGLVLIAKNQVACNKLWSIQEKSLIEKKYFAFCDGSNFEKKLQTPFNITSMFRSFGVGGKKVKAVFLDTNEAKKLKGKIYTTEVLSIVAKKFISDNVFAVSARILKGYRHQIRKHLSSYDLPILGDKLYNENVKYERLQLFAIELTFPNIDTESSYKVKYQIKEPKNILS